MFDRLLSIFSCRHNRFTFPQKDRRTKQITVCCLDCGRRLTYDWQQMKRGGRIETNPVKPVGPDAAAERVS